MSVRILLADDHAVLREGLRLILESQPDFAVVGAAADGREAVERAQALRPDVVLMDLSMPELDGISATALIAETCPESRVIVLSMLATREHVLGAVRAGARGYLLKESAGRQVVEAVRRVAAGGRYMSQGASALLADDAAAPGNTAGSPAAIERLSAREREVFRLLVEGRAPKEIAAALGVSPKSVDTYRARLMRKLGADSLPALVKIALRAGLTGA